MSKKRIIIISIVIVFCIGIILFLRFKEQLFSEKQSTEPVSTGQGSHNSRPLNVNALVIAYDTISDIFRTKGILLPNEEVDLSFESSGKITQISFKEGSSVKKGQLLAKVNDELLQAELHKLKAQLPLAIDRVSRQKTLLAKDAVSQESYQSVYTELEKLKADIELIKARISQTELRAPFDGVIGLRLVSEGAYTSPSTIITKLTNISLLKIEFSINERQVNVIKEGMSIDFTLDNDLNIYRANIYALESKLDPKTLSLKARGIYANPERKLKPGQSANIEIKLKEIDNALVIPAISLVAEMGNDFVYLYQDGKAKKVSLKKGIRTASSVQITEGLTPGDTLLISGVMQLRDGMPVTIDNILNSKAQ